MAEKPLGLASYDQVLEEEGYLSSLRQFGRAILNTISCWISGLRLPISLQGTGAGRGGVGAPKVLT